MKKLYLIFLLLLFLKANAFDNIEINKYQFKTWSSFSGMRLRNIDFEGNRGHGYYTRFVNYTYKYESQFNIGLKIPTKNYYIQLGINSEYFSGSLYNIESEGVFYSTTLGNFKICRLGVQLAKRRMLGRNQKFNLITSIVYRFPNLLNSKLNYYEEVSNNFYHPTSYQITNKQINANELLYKNRTSITIELNRLIWENPNFQSHLGVKKASVAMNLITRKMSNYSTTR